MDFPYLVRKLAPTKELKAPLQVHIPDTCVFAKGMPRFICSIGSVSPFLHLIKIIRNRDRLMFSEIRKFFQEKPDVVDNNDFSDFKEAATFLQDERHPPNNKTARKIPSIEKNYTFYFEREIYDTINDKSLVSYLMKQKGDLIWKTIKYIQRKVTEDPAAPEPIR